MVRVAVLSLLVVAATASAARADPVDARVGLFASRIGLDSSVRQTRIPGPGVAVDLSRRWWRWGGLGLHLAGSSGFDRTHDPDNTPHDTHSFDALLQLHLSVELRRGRIALSGGLGIDAYHVEVTSVSDGAMADSRTYTSLGGHLQVAVRVATLRHGALELVGDAGLFPLIDVAELASGGESSAREGSALALGVAYRPR